MSASRRPTRAELDAARGLRVPDLIREDLAVLFCGINPSLYSAAVGHHFARPGNRFWPALHDSGFTPRRLFPPEERELLELGIGITNIVDEATATADQLTTAQLVDGGRRLARKVERYRPKCIAFLGIGSYRAAFDLRKATPGRQPELFAGAIAWVLPNPSGLNAHYQPRDLARLFGELRHFLARH